MATRWSRLLSHSSAPSLLPSAGLRTLIATGLHTLNFWNATPSSTATDARTNSHDYTHKTPDPFAIARLRRLFAAVTVLQGGSCRLLNQPQ